MNLENVFDELIVAKKEVSYCPATGLDASRPYQPLVGTERNYASNSIKSSFNE